LDRTFLFGNFDNEQFKMATVDENH